MNQSETQNRSSEPKTSSVPLMVQCELSWLRGYASTAEPELWREDLQRGLDRLEHEIERVLDPNQETEAE